MDESMKQLTAEREAWRGLKNKEKRALRGRYLRWTAAEFQRGYEYVMAALQRTGGDPNACTVRIYEALRIVDGRPRLVGWIVGANETGEEIAAFNFGWPCPGPGCPEL